MTLPFLFKNLIQQLTYVPLGWSKVLPRRRRPNKAEIDGLTLERVIRYKSGNKKTVRSRVEDSAVDY